jgi:2-methylaconitate cis-trans-isomerase PrpF
VLPGSVASRYVAPPAIARGAIAVEHPAGRIEVDLDITGTAARPEVRRASIVRTARRIFEGNVLVPESLFT